MLAISNVTCNPFVYFWLNKELIPFAFVFSSAIHHVVELPADLVGVFDIVALKYKNVKEPTKNVAS